MEDRADVGDRQKIREVIVAGFEVDNDFGKGGDERIGLAVARIVVTGGDYQSLTG